MTEGVQNTTTKTLGGTDVTILQHISGSVYYSRTHHHHTTELPWPLLPRGPLVRIITATEKTVELANLFFYRTLAISRDSSFRKFRMSMRHYCAIVVCKARLPNSNSNGISAEFSGCRPPHDIYNRTLFHTRSSSSTTLHACARRLLTSSF